MTRLKQTNIDKTFPLLLIICVAPDKVAVGTIFTVFSYLWLTRYFGTDKKIVNISTLIVIFCARQNLRLDFQFLYDFLIQPATLA